jgi:hypothetical protein
MPIGIVGLSVFIIQASNRHCPLEAVKRMCKYQINQDKKLWNCTSAAHWTQYDSDACLLSAEL